MMGGHFYLWILHRGSYYQIIFVCLKWNKQNTCGQTLEYYFKKKDM
jgi:hypothetical protein